MSPSKCSCEDIAHGPCGLIEQDERLGRLLYFPDHVRSDFTPKPGAFPISHIKDKGLSLVRVNRLDDKAFVAFASALANQSADRTWFGHVEFGVNVARAMTDEDGIRMVCLFEDPTGQHTNIPENPAHATLISASHPMSEADAKEVRAELVRNGVVKVASGRGAT